ncbi:YeeE/YedE family protein [Rhodovibrionaceae bacterium A322]
MQKPWLILALAASVGLGLFLFNQEAKRGLLFLIGLGLGFSLYHAAFGFTAAYRRAWVEKDSSGVIAQLVMLALALLLFAPILTQGEAFGHGVSGAVAPVSPSMAFGAFLFGIGMQLGGGCASGTLFTAGGGNLRMALVLIFFCFGAFWGSLDLAWWQSSFPGLGPVSLPQELGWESALPLQLALLAGIYGIMRMSGARAQRPLWWSPGQFGWRSLLQGPWPFLLAALTLALLNWATLLVAGHPWSITWAFSLWSAKLAVLAGWDPGSSLFWTGAFQQAALARPVLADTTSIMNIALILGALTAAALAGKVKPDPRIPLRSLLAAVIGGLVMGYGARLAYGCNIGALFSGIASGSLHGWVWLLAALPGNWLGLQLRPLFGLSR